MEILRDGLMQPVTARDEMRIDNYFSRAVVVLTFFDLVA